MKKLRVGELAKLYGINRQSIYKRINKGELSKSADGLIDFSEALRVLGEPSERGVPVTELQQHVTESVTEGYTLKLQVEMLEKQVKKLEENERFLKEQITTKDQSIHLLQTLLSAPKPIEPSLQSEKVTEEIAPQVLSESQPTETALYSGGKKTHTEQQPRKKGFLERVIGAVFDV
ncbi:plasmid replication DNA-binding protein [Acinetobacter towneri]|uniref:plasmid replication DNA-binding protein n=1 Tax=Acinetobacter towneri TaxID=202956 RepID=UPI0032122163